MSTGKVKYFNDLKGWGFIYKTLREGQEVLYDVIQTDEGLRAHNVTPSP